MFLIMSGLGFILTVADRVLARISKLRVHENILFIVACLLGALGVMLGFFFAKRDLYKREIRVGIPAIAIGEVILLLWAAPGFFAAVRDIFK
jgi:uncharacterized membrane protein YsdA (DUF1294 family)